jgi:hypothetical protein
MQIMTQSSLTVRLKKWLQSFACIVGLAVAFEQTAAAPSHAINPPCSPLSGTFVFTLFEFTGPTTAHAEGFFLIDGEIAGTASAVYFNIEQHGEGVTHMNGEHTLTYPDGSMLLTNDEIRLQADDKNPGWARANSRLYIVDGTGEFAGATGLLHTHGEANLFTLEGSIDFKGQVCAP